MKKLSPLDQTFLWVEKRQQPMHVGSLTLYSPPEDAGENYLSEMVADLKTYNKPSHPFDKKLTQDRLGQYFLVEDTNFDIDYHFHHISLPAPGRIRELLSFVSSQHSHLLDRERPMWQVYLIEGIEGGRFAVYSKIHHSLVDGVAAMRMALRAFSPDPNERDKPPFWQMPPVQKPTKKVKAKLSPQKLIKSPTTPLQQVMDSVNNLGKSASSVGSVLKEVGQTIRLSASEESPIEATAPVSILNQKISGSRRFAAQSYSLDRIKALASHYEVTINDIVLSVCGSSLRKYLASQDALPDKSLKSMVPVSLRTDESESGNQIAMIVAGLGTHIEDPVERLEYVKSTTRHAKDRFSGMSKGEIFGYTALTMLPTSMSLMTGMAQQLQAFNVVISNVPGPQETVYWNGAKMEGFYPVSIPMDGVALNITLFSYGDQLEFGLTACRRTLPSMQRLLDYLEAGIKELEVSAGIA